MALNTSDTVPDISPRFGIAQDEPTPVDVAESQSVQREARTRIYVAAKFLNENVEQSRELSLALTHLEEALMWSGKAIFK